MKLEKKKIHQVITKNDLMNQLKSYGITSGMVLEVHSSLSSFGYVIGGAQTVVDALIDTVGYSGTILMPLHTSNNSEPTYWENPPVSCHLMQTIRDNTPIFDKKGSDTRLMGAIVDNFRRRDGIIVSNHPTCSFAAWGKYAKLLCNRHSLHFSLSEESPVARLTELKGYILLMGCDYDRCTVMHLAEYRSDARPILVQGSAVEIDGKRVWKKVLDLDLCSDDFIHIGLRLERKNCVTRFKIGNAECKLFRADLAVEEAIHYFEEESVLNYYR